MTENDEVVLHHLTEDPELEARLRERFSELGSFGLAEYAYSLGLFPPGYEEGQRHSITLVFPPGAGQDEPGMLVWDTSQLGDDEGNPEIPELDDESAEDPWADADPAGFDIEPDGFSRLTIASASLAGAQIASCGSCLGRPILWTLTNAGATAVTAGRSMHWTTTQGKAHHGVPILGPQRLAGQ
jgi:hypothetical protein